jgi:uncharacterized protein (TIGR02246 family)
MTRTNRRRMLQEISIGGTILVVSGAAQAQTADRSIESSGMGVTEAWVKAWNAHDMNALAEVVDERVDFITVGGRWLQGREAFRKHHTQVHEAQMRDSVFEVRKTHVQRLTSDVVLMHVEWTMRGDRNTDGTARPPSRDGIFTWILMQSGGRWRVRASQNTSLTVSPSAK